MSLICLSIRKSVQVGLFVGTSSRMPIRISVFGDVCVGFVCRSCLSETLFDEGAVMNAFRRFSN